jgi:hypothetical protein
MPQQKTSKAKLKAEHKDKMVAFGGGGRKTLGERDDLDKLAIIGLESGDRTILDLFEEPIPSLEELKKDQTDAQLKEAPAQIPPQVPNNSK